LRKQIRENKRAGEIVKERMSEKTPFLQMKGITKNFPGVLALDNVDFEVNRGEVVALVGENGAGKSTLMKILSGAILKDGGDIFINGQCEEIKNPLASIKLGISTIYQELNVLANLDIAENIFIGKELHNKGFIDKKSMHIEAQKLLEKVGLYFNTHSIVSSMSTAQKQMIEVARALSFDAKIIIMDEPTSSLTETETERLMMIIRELKKQNIAVIFITHRMKEIFEIADRVTVMRDGKMVCSLDITETNQDEVIRHMVGREIENIFVKDNVELGEIVMEVENLNTKDFLKDISFFVRKGEILGFAGLVGAGRSEVMRAVFGVDKKESGTVKINHKEVRIDDTVDALKHGIGFLPEDRKEQALVLGMSVKENITLACLSKLAKLHMIDKNKEVQTCEEYTKKLRIKTPSIEQLVMNLSGGNQQKVVIGKWMATNPRILILDEPTRGIDVGSKKEIHQLMSLLAKSGVAIIMISSELPEIMGMSDRIIVMHEGRIKGELMREDASQERIMKVAIS
jgi:ABC-type sugar transport system ATPase subunit